MDPCDTAIGCEMENWHSETHIMSDREWKLHKSGHWVVTWI